MEAYGNYLFSRVNASIIIDIHFPLMKRSNRECSLALALGNTCVLEIGQSTSSKLKQPSLERS